MNPTQTSSAPASAAGPQPDVLAAAFAACRRVAPLWPLSHFVAVNPFVGLTGRPFAEVCELMQRLAPGGMQMPASYYAEKLAAGQITDTDLEAALAQAPLVLPATQAAAVAHWGIARLKEALTESTPVLEEEPILTVAEAADLRHGADWVTAITEALSQFCAAYFDQGQSAWRLPWKNQPLFAAWREAARCDATPELMGLAGFRERVGRLPEDPARAILASLESFGVDREHLEDLLHKELFSIRGWAGHAQYLTRERRSEGTAEDLVFQLLAIRLAYDAAVLAKVDSPEFREFWPASARESGATVESLSLLLWQMADEHAWQRQLDARLRAARTKTAPAPAQRPPLQAVFCIDVRSELIRRALESAMPGAETVGFAGFFGLPMEYLPFGTRHGAAQCPVLLSPKYRVRETLKHTTAAEAEEALRKKRLGKRITLGWNSFKTSAISCFSFVETAGLGFGLKLFRDAFAPASPEAPATPRSAPELTVSGHGDAACGIALADRVTLAQGALKNMGLTKSFARLVLLCGHGSLTANNPYGSGLDCGACGGHSGSPNARVGAAILNDPEVREVLVGEGVVIPKDTWFVAGMHNTTTDQVELFDVDLMPHSHWQDLERLLTALYEVARTVRRERAPLLGLAAERADLDAQVIARSRDWAQVRPEWGLAGNAAFIAAPRERTRNAKLGGRVFLHNYDWRADGDSSVLELIMCAPMVVANWINLQYLASTVNNAAFGSGNKVLHNVIGTLGVCLGNGGDLQTGLPLQSVHDGRKWIHEPLRLHVYLEAPRERIAAVLAKHEGVRHLVDHGWLLLSAMEDEGAAIWRCLPGARWEAHPA